MATRAAKGTAFRPYDEVPDGGPESDVMMGSTPRCRTHVDVSLRTSARNVDASETWRRLRYEATGWSHRGSDDYFLRGRY
jgi:hypothetical protein